MAYDIERYLNVRSAVGPSFSVDGDLTFRMDTTGTQQVWRLDEPGGWPDQLTFETEPVTFAAHSPTRDELVFGMDVGGNERTQLFRLAGDGSDQLELTQHPDAIHYWGGWSHDGDRFAFAANRRDESVFDVYVQGRDETGDDAECVYESDGWLAPAGWSPDDSTLVLHEGHSNVDHDLYVLDLDTGECTRLTPDCDGGVRFGSVAWAPNGDLLVCTDVDSDTLYLARMDAVTGDLETLEDGGDWNVEAVAANHEHGLVAYVRNVDGFSEVTLADVSPDGLDPYPRPDLPTGVLGGLSFGPDGDRVAFSLSAATDNSNVHVVDVETGERTKWTRASTAGIPQDTFVKPEIVHYESFDDLEIPALFTVPESGDAPFPVIVDFHGGPESQRRPFFHSLRQYFVDNGYAVFEPNVRGSTGYGRRFSELDDVEKRMDSVADGAAGVDWLTARDDVDPDGIVAYGGSYGGFMVLASMTEYPDRWAAGVDIVGIANFITFLENTGDWRRSAREAEYGSLADDREFLADISPINNIEKIRAPLLVLHGANDPRVPVGEAEQIAEEAAKHVPVEKLIFEDEGHGFSKLENRIEAYSTVVEFLDEHLS